jgi:hypothetical protein
MFMLEQELNRIAVIAAEAVDVTVLHIRRIAAALGTALDRTKREVSDLAWDYTELAGSVRRNTVATDALTDQHIADVISIDLRRRLAN